MLNPTNVTTTVTIAGEKQELVFDLNTMAAFEEASGVFFLDFVYALHAHFTEQQLTDKDAMAKLSKEAVAERFMRVITKLSIKNVRALLWAALHTYDAHDNPVWPYTQSQIARKLGMQDLQAIILPLWMGANQALQAETADADAERPQQGPGQQVIAMPLPQSNGGSPSGPSDGEVLASLTEKSDA
jgi:hypothetical protein